MSSVGLLGRPASCLTRSVRVLTSPLAEALVGGIVKGEEGGRKGEGGGVGWEDGRLGGELGDW